MGGLRRVLVLGLGLGLALGLLDRKCARHLGEPLFQTELMFYSLAVVGSWKTRAI